MNVVKENQQEQQSTKRNTKYEKKKKNLEAKSEESALHARFMSELQRK